MKIAVVSDLHLGRGDRTDRFGHQPSAFHRFLDSLEGVADELVLLGDIIDTHHGTIPFAFLRELRITCDVYAGLADRLLGGRYHLVSGNHDHCLADLPGVREELIFNDRGAKMLMSHGHQYDRLVANAPHLCAAGNWLGGRAEARGVPGVLRFLDWFDDFANGVTRDRSLVYRDYALANARERACNIIVLGHTHQQDDHREGGVHYLNVGACLQGRFEYGLVDTRTGDAAVSSWEGE